MVGVNKGMFTHIGIPQIAKAQQKKCFYCGKKLKRAAMTRDHLKPKCDGNSLTLNCVISCLCCNGKKGPRQPTHEEIIRARNIYQSIGCPVFAI